MTRCVSQVVSAAAQTKLSALILIVVLLVKLVASGGAGVVVVTKVTRLLIAVVRVSAVTVHVTILDRFGFVVHNETGSGFLGQSPLPLGLVRLLLEIEFVHKIFVNTAAEHEAGHGVKVREDCDRHDQLGY